MTTLMLIGEHLSSLFWKMRTNMTLVARAGSCGALRAVGTSSRDSMNTQRRVSQAPGKSSWCGKLDGNPKESDATTHENYKPSFRETATGWLMVVGG